MKRANDAAVIFPFSAISAFGRRTSGLVVVLIFGELLCAVKPSVSSDVKDQRQDRKRHAGPGLRQLLLLPSSQWDDHASVSSGIKCYSFTTPPLRTYCLMLGRTAPLDVHSALHACDTLNMFLPNSSQASVDRLRTVMRLFHVEKHKLWLLAETKSSDEVVLFSWDQCIQPSQVLNVSSVAAGCQICNITVVCEAHFYSFNVSNCVTVDGGAGEMEYCYYKERVTAYESTNRCLERSAVLLDAETVSIEIQRAISWLIYSQDKFWLDQKREVDQVNETTSYTRDFDETSCLIVHFSPALRWVLKVNCSETYSIFCVFKWPRHEISTRRIPRCPGQLWQRQLRDSAVCVDYRPTYNFTDALSFCKQHSMKLLDESTLGSFFNSRFFSKHLSRVSYEDYLIWDAGFAFTWTPISSVCLATLLDERPAGRHPRRCSMQFPYICGKNKTEESTLPGQSGEFYCDGMNNTSRSHPRKCLNRDGLTFQQSVDACEQLGMYLIPEGLQDLDYEQLIDEEANNTHQSDAILHWLHPLRNCSGRCVALALINGTFLQRRMNCSEKLPSICLFPPAIFPLPANDEAPCEDTESWPAPGMDFATGQSEVQATNETAASKCDKDGHSADDSAVTCTSSELREQWELLQQSSHIEAISKRLGNLENEVMFPGDIKAMCHHVEQVLKKFEELAAIISDAEKAQENENLVRVLFRFVSKVMLMTNLWKCFPEKERLDIAAELFTKVQSFASQVSRV